MSDNLPERYFGHAEIDLMARHAKAFAISGLFEDIRGEVQAYVKVAAGAEMGLLPFESMGAFDVIKGKVVANAGFLASKVKGHSKYDFRVIEVSNDRAEILFREKVDQPDGSWVWENLGSSVFTMDDAKQAGLLGRGDMYQKFSRNMLQSRAMSNGVAWFCPDVLSTRVYEQGEVPAPAERPEQDGGELATVPEREPENVIDVEPEPETVTQAEATAQSRAASEEQRRILAEAAKAPEQVAHEADQRTTAEKLKAHEPAEAAKTAPAGATKIPLTDDPNGPSHTFDPSVDPLLSVETATRLNEQAADDAHSAREAEVAAQESPGDPLPNPTPPDPEPPFGGTQPLPPPGAQADPPLTPDEQKELGWTDADKVAAIGRLFNPNDPNALPTDIRLKVKKACEILEIWDKNTPQALFLLFGDAAMTSKGLEEVLAKALDEQKARKDAEKVATPETAVQTPEAGLSSVASALKAQDAKVAQVLGVLNALTKDQAAALADLLAAQGQPADATPETMAKELWLGYGPAALSADTLLAALDQPPWESGPA